MEDKNPIQPSLHSGNSGEGTVIVNNCGRLAVVKICLDRLFICFFE